MRATVPGLSITTVALLLGCAPAAEQLAAPAMVTDCVVPGTDAAARCVTIQVPENHDDPASRRIDLYAVVLPALGEGTADPLLVLQGGPGVAGTSMARTWSTREALRQHRDLVFIDQRGVGRSNPLSCAFLGRSQFLGALMPPDHLEACRAELATRADLSQYTNEASARDLELLRQALGVERWSLYGVSFGTRLAQSYARRYPDRAASVVLDGVVPFDAELTGDLAESMQASLEYVTSRCASDAACAARYPDVSGRLAQLAERLDSEPAVVSVTDSVGDTLSGRFGRWELAYAVRGMLYGGLATTLPAMVHEAATSGDFTAFARAYWTRSRWVGDSSGQALHLGVYCSEDLPFIDSLAVARRAQSSLMRDLYYRAYRDGCNAWPVTPVPAALREPWVSSTPVLLFSGERDPVTPPAYGERVARSLSRATHIEFAGGGHSEPSPCKTAITVAFLDHGRVNDADRACLASATFPPFVIR